MIDKIKRFRFLEWLWVAHTALWVLLGAAYLSADGGGIGLGLLLGALSFPLIWPLSYWHFFDLLPDGLLDGIWAVVLFGNGWLWYAALRRCFRKKPRAGRDVSECAATSPK